MNASKDLPLMTVQDMLNLAVQHHSSGQQEDAKAIFQKVLGIDPSQPTALHLLGVIAHQAGNNDVAFELISKAVHIKPSFAEAHNNLGTVLNALERFDDAVLSYQTALSYKPNYSDAYYNLGINFGALDRYDDAVISYLKAVALNPNFFKAYVKLGHTYELLGRLHDATASYERAISIMPEAVDVLFRLGKTLQSLSERGRAVECYQKILEVQPDNAIAFFNLGKLYHELGQLDAAIEANQKGLHLSPETAIAHSNLGWLFQDMGEMKKAHESYQQALVIDPNLLVAHYNMGNLFQIQKQFKLAIASFNKALDIDPDFVKALSNKGAALNDLGDLDGAISCYRSVIFKQPSYAEGHNNLGNSLLNLGNPDAAVARFQKAIEYKPDYADAHSNLLMTEHYRVGHTEKSLYPLHREWDERHGAIHKASWSQHDNSSIPDRPLKVGFVSPDLGRHPVGYFAVGLLENLRDFNIKTYCYSDRVADDLTIRIKAATDIWRDIRRSAHKKVAALISDDGIDILIDLTGHSANSRLLVFARKPAPIQVSWAGYVGTTGISAMDYLISDKFSTHPDEEQYYSESILRMPNQWLSYDPPSYAPDVGPLPLKKNGHVTFGSFSNPGKLNAGVVSVWAKILHAVDGARLVIKYRHMGTTSNVERLAKMFETEGIDSSRLTLEGRSPHADLLARYNDIDIALDPFPYSGGVTTYEALWMGVPVITVPGDTFASRHSLSHLTTVGHPEFVADNQDEYIRLAVQLAKDEERLLAVRSGLREKMKTSPACDHRQFAQNFSSLLRGAWKEWCLQQNNNAQSE